MLRFRSVVLTAVIAVGVAQAGLAGETAAVVDEPDTLPVPVNQVKPQYPIGERRAGLSGVVVVKFVVDPTGGVREAAAAEASDEAFGVAAVAAVQQWKFKPALLRGVPVACSMQVPIVFSINGAIDVRTPIEVKNKGRPDLLPERYRYDTPPTVELFVDPVYPYDLLREHVNGSATVACLVNEQGRITDVAVVAASKPEFGYALQAALPMYRCKPAMRGGKPVRTIMRITHPFDWKSAGEDDRLLHRLEKNPSLTAKRQQLDQPIRATAVAEPVFPPCLLGVASAGSARIEIIIDESGRVRLGRVLAASRPEFGYSALQAVDRWAFTAPTVHGRKSMAKVVVPFEFRSPVADAKGE